ncbi:MAG: AI-2E family transporter [Ruminococcaceae bacterium]|nr:AI-2E family transporter [Oscillospiraceae bacterium]
MNFTYEKIKKLTRWLIGITTACILIFLGVQNIDVVANAVSWATELIMPLILGFALALILNMPMRFFESHIWSKTNKKGLQKLRRPLSFIISLVLIIGILVGVVWLVIPELVEAIKVIVQGVIGLVNRLSGMSEAELAELPLGSVLINTDWNKLLDSLQTWLKNQSGTIVNTAVGTITSLVGGIYDFFISFVFAIYILFSKDKLKAQAKRMIRVWLPKSFGEWSIHAASVANQNFSNFISGQSLEAVILGVLCMIGMWIFGFPYAPMIGALVGVTALIPVVGAFIGAGVGAFMILTVEPMKAVFFIIFILVLQQLEENLIYPRVMGSRVNLPGMWILAAVTVGGGIAGPVGMLLSVPIASTAYVLIKEATINREQKIEKRNENE